MSLGEYQGAGAATTRLLLHLNGNSNDSSGNGLNGTDTNMTYSKNYGKFNEGAYFNGSGQIRLGNSTVLQPDIITISMWIKRTTTSESTPTLIMRDNGLVSYASAYCIYLTTTTGYIRYEQQQPGGTYVAVQSTIAITDTTTWHHVCVTRNPTAGTTYIYLDGNLVGSGTGNTTAIYYGTTRQGTNIGAYIYGDGSMLARYTGYMDEVIIENYGWTIQQVQKYYTNSLGRFGTI